MILLLPWLVLPYLGYEVGQPDKQGYVVAAPHDGYDRSTGALARGLAQRLGWGWVEATGYRSFPRRRWLDVNRPTERPWQPSGGFGSRRHSAPAEALYLEYRRHLRWAAQLGEGDRVALLLEVHGHGKRVSVGRQSIPVQVIELATQGFTYSELRALQRDYGVLVERLPQSERVPLAIDRLHRTYDYLGHRIRFTLRATGAKREGALQLSEVQQGLHFELPPAVRTRAASRRRYVTLLSDLVQGHLRRAHARGSSRSRGGSRPGASPGSGSARPR